jgi:hypothetical protein
MQWLLSSMSFHITWSVSCSPFHAIDPIKSIKCYYINQEPRLEMAPHIWTNFMEFLLLRYESPLKALNTLTMLLHWSLTRVFSFHPLIPRMCRPCSILSGQPLFCPLVLLVPAGLKNVNFLLGCVLFVLMRLSQHLSSNFHYSNYISSVIQLT